MNRSVTNWIMPLRNIQKSFGQRMGYWVTVTKSGAPFAPVPRRSDRAFRLHWAGFCSWLAEKAKQMPLFIVINLTIYIKECKLYTRLHTKTTDRHMYLNYFSEHPMYQKRSIQYSQYLRLKRTHSEPHYLLEAQIHMYLLVFCRKDLCDARVKPEVSS